MLLLQFGQIVRLGLIQHLLLAFKASGECRINFKDTFSKFDQYWQGAVLISSSRVLITEERKF